MAGSFFHEMRQQQNIGQAKADAREAQRSAEGAQEVMRRLEKKVDSLTGITRALWTILREQHGLEEQDLLLRVQQLTGGERKGAQACSQCGRVVGKSQAKCMYCGTARQVESIFDTL